MSQFPRVQQIRRLFNAGVVPSFTIPAAVNGCILIVQAEIRYLNVSAAPMNAGLAIDDHRGTNLFYWPIYAVNGAPDWVSASVDEPVVLSELGQLLTVRSTLTPVGANTAQFIAVRYVIV